MYIPKIVIKIECNIVDVYIFFCTYQALLINCIHVFYVAYMHVLFFAISKPVKFSYTSKYNLSLCAFSIAFYCYLCTQPLYYILIGYRAALNNAVHVIKK